jgi:hypothetical protein
MADQPVAPPQSIQFDAPAAGAASTAAPTDAPPQTIQFDQPSDQSAEQPYKPPTIGGVANVVKDEGIGFAKGVGQTAEFVMRHIPGVSDYMAPALDRADQPGGVLQPTNENQKIGLTAESVAEFLGGDEILKGLSVGAKYAKVGKVMDLLEESPRLRRAVNLGMQSLRQGTVAGVQAAAHGASPTEAAETAGTAAGLGAGAGLATDAVGAGAGWVKQGAKRVLSAFTEPTSADTAGLTSRSLQDIQPRLQSGLRSILKSVENGAAIQAPEGAVESPSIRDAVSDTADKFHARAKSTYADLDQATGGHFQRFENAMRDLNREMNEFVSSPDEENLAKEAELSQRRANIEAAQDAAFDRAKAQGVDPKLIESARADFKRSQALYDLDFNLKKSVSGARPELFDDPEAAAKNPEIVDPKKLDLRLNNMYDTGRLQEAVGDANAKKLLKDASDRLMEHRDNVLAATKAAQKRIASNAAIRTGTKVAAAAAGLPVLTRMAPAVTHLFIPGQGVRPVE